MQRCRKKQKLGRRWEKKDSKGCGLLKSLLTTGVAQHEMTILQTPLSIFKLI